MSKKKKKTRIPEEAWVTLQHQDFWRKPVSEWKDLSTWDEYFLQNNSGTRTIKASHDSLQAELNVLIQHGDKRTKELKKVLSIQEELKVSILANVLHPAPMVWGRRVFGPMLAIHHLRRAHFLLNKFVLHPAPMVWGRRASGLLLAISP
ncbi:unnamed protein product [Rhizophagus irregularis]|nr:unnamed protein product [Rhizophagus irregularis]